MNFAPTDLPPGSVEKIELMRQRADAGLPLSHENDRIDFAGYKGVVALTQRVRRSARVGRSEIKMVAFSRKRLSE